MKRSPRPYEILTGQAEEMRAPVWPLWLMAITLASLVIGAVIILRPPEPHPLSVHSVEVHSSGVKTQAGR